MKYSSPERNRRVLVIDDNRAIHDDFRKILNGAAVESGALAKAEAVLFEEQAHAQRPMPFQIDSAYQGQEGLARVQMAIQARCPYAVAFVDVRMPPGWDGVETIQRIWEVDPDLQVVVCTAYSDYSWDEMINKVGNSDRMLILKKPFDIVEVLQLASALTEKWWLQQQVKCQVDELELKVTERTKKLQEANEMLQLEVAERKQAEATLQIKTEQLQAITDAMVAFLQSGGEHVPSSILLHNALKQTGSECGFVAVVMDGPTLRILAHAGIGWDETVHQGAFRGRRRRRQRERAPGVHEFQEPFRQRHHQWAISHLQRTGCRFPLGRGVAARDAALAAFSRGANPQRDASSGHDRRGQSPRWVHR